MLSTCIVSPWTLGSVDGISSLGQAGDALHLEVIRLEVALGRADPRDLAARRAVHPVAMA
jgi:hypothetical protein